MRRNKILIPVIILLIAVCVELLLSAFPYFAYVAGRNGEKSTFYENEPFTVTEENNGVSAMFDRTVLNGVSMKIKPHSVNADGEATMEIYAEYASSPGALKLIFEKKIGFDPYSGEMHFYLNPEEEITAILLEFSDFSRDFDVYDLTVNPDFVFNFNYLRALIIFAICLTVYLVKSVKELFKSMGFKRVAVITVTACVFTTALFSVVCATYDSAEMLDYNSETDIAKKNPYIQQFDAFQKGQLHIDVEPDPDLVKIENPYDPFQRSEVSYLWDRAFYGGKYYSYFGTAPIFTVYYPAYFLTGRLPADSTVTAIFSLMISVFLPLAVMLLSKLINSGISPWFASLNAFGAFGASMTFLLQRGCQPFYYFASISGMAFASATAFFTIYAYICKKKRLSVLLYLLSGLSFALCIHSRINSAFAIGIVLIAFWILMFSKRIKEKKIKSFMLDALAFGIPVAIGIVGAMLYNYARFRNPFEFGSSYQLTVANTSLYSLSISGIFPTLYQYFIHPFGVTFEFPFIYMNSDTITDFGKYVYNDSGLGLFAMPYMLILLLGICVLKNKKVSSGRKIMLLSSLAAMAITAFIDFCLGGVIFRYTSDFTLVAALTCSAIAFQLYGNALLEKRADAGSIIFKSTGALCGFNSIVAILSMFISDYNLCRITPSVFDFVRDIFVFWK